MTTKVTFEIAGDASKGIAAIDQLHRKLAALTNQVGLRNLHATFAQAATAASHLNNALRQMNQNLQSFNRLNTLTQNISNNFKVVNQQVRHLNSQVTGFQATVTRLNAALGGTARAMALAFRSGAFAARSGGFSGAQALQSLGIGFRMSGLAVGSSISAFGAGGQGFLGTLLSLPKLLSGVVTTGTELGVRLVTATLGGALKMGGALASGLVNMLTGAVGGALSLIPSMLTKGLGDAVRFVGQGLSALLTGITNFVGEAVLQIGNIFTGLAEIAQRTFSAIVDIGTRVLGGFVGVVERIVGKIGGLLGSVGKGVFGAGALVGGMAFKGRADTELGLARAEVLLEERLTPGQRTGLHQWVREMNREIAPLMERSEIAATLERVISTGFQGSLEEAKKVAENSLRLATSLGEKESSSAARAIAKAVGLFRDEFEKQGKDPFSEITNSIFNLVNYGDLRLPEIVDRLGEILASGKAVNATFLQTMTLLAQMSQSLGVEQTFTDVRHLLVDPLKFSDDALGLLKSRGISENMIGNDPIGLIESIKKAGFSSKELAEIFPNKRALVGFLVQMFQDPALGEAIARGMQNNRGLDQAGDVIKNTLAAKLSRIWQAMKSPFDVTFDVTDSPIKKFFDGVEEQLMRLSNWWKKMIDAPEAAQFLDNLSGKFRALLEPIMGSMSGEGLSASSFWGGLSKGLDTVWQVSGNVIKAFETLYGWIAKIAQSSGVFEKIAEAMSPLFAWLSGTGEQLASGSTENIDKLVTDIGAASEKIKGFFSSIWDSAAQEVEVFSEYVEMRFSRAFDNLFLKAARLAQAISTLGLGELFGGKIGPYTPEEIGRLSPSGAEVGSYSSFRNTRLGQKSLSSEDDYRHGDVLLKPRSSATGLLYEEPRWSPRGSGSPGPMGASGVVGLREAASDLKGAAAALRGSASMFPSAKAALDVIQPPGMPRIPTAAAAAPYSFQRGGHTREGTWLNPSFSYSKPMFPSAAAASAFIQPMLPTPMIAGAIPQKGGSALATKMMRGEEWYRKPGDLAWKPVTDAVRGVTPTARSRRVGASPLGLTLGADFEGVGGTQFGFGLSPSSFKKKLERASRDPDFEGGKWNRFLKNTEKQPEAGADLKGSAENMEKGTVELKEGATKVKEATDKVSEAATVTGKDFKAAAETIVGSVKEMQGTVTSAFTMLKDEIARMRNEMTALKNKIGSGTSGASGGS